MTVASLKWNALVIKLFQGQAKGSLEHEVWRKPEFRISVKYSTAVMSWTLDGRLFYFILLYKHQWNTKWAFPRKLHIFTREDNMLSLHVKRSLFLWLHNKSRLFHRSLYNKQNITCPLVDMNFIFSCSTLYLTREISSWTLEDKIHIHARPCNILYILVVLYYWWPQFNDSLRTHLIL